jgi:hypothetical protein
MNKRSDVSSSCFYSTKELHADCVIEEEWEFGKLANVVVCARMKNKSLCVCLLFLRENKRRKGFLFQISLLQCLS